MQKKLNRLFKKIQKFDVMKMIRSNIFLKTHITLLLSMITMAI